MESIERSGVITMNGKPVTLVGPELHVGDKAPAFTICDGSMSVVSLKDFAGKVKVISVTPSLDTPVCDAQARYFNDKATRISKDVEIINISLDLPFALKRYCAAKCVDRVLTLSDYRDRSFGKAYGVLIKEIGLLCRALFVIDKDDVIRYIQIVPEVTHSPEYEPMLDVISQLQ